MRLLTILCVSCLYFHTTYAQQSTATLLGKVQDENNQPIAFAVFTQKGKPNVLLGISNERGNFSLVVPAEDTLTYRVTHVGYQTKEWTLWLAKNEIRNYTVHLSLASQALEEVKIQGNPMHDISMQSVDPKALAQMPSPFGDFGQSIASGAFLGMQNNNELSSQYSVRGGSFDENAVYVNGIAVYRPLLTKYGRQEGLSFVNTDLVRSVNFSSGGWSSQYGDKMSSVLRVEYQAPKDFQASAQVSLLNAKAHMGGSSKNQRWHWISGVRYKSARYLLNTLPTQGEYLPSFVDWQNYIEYDISSKKDSRSTLGVLTSFAQNDYFVKPVLRQSVFGTSQNLRRLTVAFDGTDQLRYRTFQSGLRWKYKGAQFSSSIAASFVQAREREYTDLEYGYRLCDLIDPARNPDACQNERALGTEYRNARNLLDAKIYSIAHDHSLALSPTTDLEFGSRLKSFFIDDLLNTYSFKDSADIIQLLPSQKQSHRLSYEQWAGYVQVRREWQSQQLTYGVRLLYHELNGEWNLNPRLQYQWQWKRYPNWNFKAATGMYSQPSFYREMRKPNGSLNTAIKNQQAFHFILTGDYQFKQWKRPFILTVSSYYKHLLALVPFDIENLNLRYFGDNLADGYAAGVDFRLNGEFIEGIDSWVNLSLLTTREDFSGDSRSFIRRPTDQRWSVAVFFQDYLADYPSFQVQFRILYGSGLPFGPPNRRDLRNTLSAGTSYLRSDVGFSKTFSGRRANWVLLLEVLNLFAASNTISFLWVRDLDGKQHAVPNTLSQRFFNFKVAFQYR